MNLHCRPMCARGVLFAIIAAICFDVAGSTESEQIDLDEVDDMLRVSSDFLSRGEVAASTRTLLMIQRVLQSTASRDKEALSVIWNNIGVHWVRTQGLAEAVAAFSTAYEIDPTDVDTAMNLGRALLRLRNGPTAESTSTLLQLVKSTKERTPWLLHSLAECYAESKDFNAAAHWASRALNVSLGLVTNDVSRSDSGQTLLDDITGSVLHYSTFCARWADADAAIARITQPVQVASSHIGIAGQGIPSVSDDLLKKVPPLQALLHLDAALLSRWSVLRTNQELENRRRTSGVEVLRTMQLRTLRRSQYLSALCADGNDGIPTYGLQFIIGYVVGPGMMTNHPVAQHLLPLLQAHQTLKSSEHRTSAGARMSVVLVDMDPSAVQHRVRAEAHSSVDVVIRVSTPTPHGHMGTLDTASTHTEVLDIDSVANEINALRVAVLVDMHGHTQGGQPQLFARTPALVTVSMLGWLGPTGNSDIDFVASDKVATPPEMLGHDSQYGHRDAMLLLRRGYIPSGYDISFPPRPDRTKTDISRTNQIVASLNQLYKFDTRAGKLWREIIGKLPRARLWLLKFPPCAVGNVEAALEPYSDRIVWDNIEESKALHLRRLADGGISVWLDPLVYNGGTTTVDALWSGIPVVSLAGDSFVRRMAASQMISEGCIVGLVRTERDYVNVATSIAAHPDRAQCPLHATTMTDDRSKSRTDLGSQDGLFNTQRWAQEWQTALRCAVETVLFAGRKDVDEAPNGDRRRWHVVV